MIGAIVLLSPPRFLVCTHPQPTRVALFNFFEIYLERQAVAFLPPYVRMPHHIAENTLLAQLLEFREGDMYPDLLSRELVKVAKRISYGAATRRLPFVVPDQAAAASWHAKSISFRWKRLQLLCPATMEREDGTSPAATVTPADRNLLHYQVCVLVTGVAACTGQSILASSVSCAVTR